MLWNHIFLLITFVFLLRNSLWMLLTRLENDSSLQSNFGMSFCKIQKSITVFVPSSRWSNKSKTTSLVSSLRFSKGEIFSTTLILSEVKPILTVKIKSINNKRYKPKSVCNNEYSKKISAISTPFTEKLKNSLVDFWKILQFYCPWIYPIKIRV